MATQLQWPTLSRVRLTPAASFHKPSTVLLTLPIDSPTRLSGAIKPIAGYRSAKQGRIAFCAARLRTVLLTDFEPFAMSLILKVRRQ